MPSQRVIEQVHGILARAEIRFALGQDRSSYLVPVPGGSAAVVINFHDWGRGQTMISLRSDVLVDVEVGEQNRIQVLEHLNALNQASLFGRFHLDADLSTVVLQHDLLGDHLQSDELINALFTVGVLADDADDQLLREFGSGLRAVDLDDGPITQLDFNDAREVWRRPPGAA